MLCRSDILRLGSVARRDLGQLGAFFVRTFVLAFLVQGQKSVEQGDCAGSTQGDLLVGGNHVHRCAFLLGAFHLAGDGALPNQFIKPGGIGIEIFCHFFGRARETGGAHRFMRFLSVLGLAGIDPRRRRHIAGAIFLADNLARLGDGFRHHDDAVGTHISDEAGGLAADLHAFIQSLGHLHGALGIEAQLARSFLLQGRGDEGRLRIAFDRRGFDAADGKVLRLDRFYRAGGIGLVGQRKLFQLLAIQLDQPRREGARAGFDIGFDAPIFLRLEGLDLDFAFHHQAQRHRLHTTRRARARQFAPQHRRQRKADKIVQGAARQIGVHQFLVDLAGMGDGFEDRRFGDGVKHHPLDRHFQGMLFLQYLQDVPADGFAFPVRVGCQDQLVGAFHGAGDVLHLGLGAGVNLPDHREIVIGLHRPVLGRQVADMAEAGQHFVAGAEILIDGLGFGGGFDDEDVHAGLIYLGSWGNLGHLSGAGWVLRQDRAGKWGFSGAAGGTLIEAERACQRWVLPEYAT